jgi:hypothetical protein
MLVTVEQAEPLEAQIDRRLVITVLCDTRADISGDPETV